MADQGWLARIYFQVTTVAIRAGACRKIAGNRKKVRAGGRILIFPYRSQYLIYPAMSNQFSKTTTGATPVRLFEESNLTATRKFRQVGRERPEVNGLLHGSRRCRQWPRQAIRGGTDPILVAGASHGCKRPREFPDTYLCRCPSPRSRQNRCERKILLAQPGRLPITYPSGGNCFRETW